MSKPKKITIKDKEYFAWKYEDQTQIKHKVLAYYFHIWIGKLGKYHNTLFMDCHGGCGAYIDNDEIISYGSSIQADKIATKINQNRKYVNYICVCEKDFQNYKNLQAVWTDQCCSKNCRIKNCDFNEALKEPKLKDYYTTHPTFFLIDPFGYDLKMKNMVQLMSSCGSEIIINFMFDHLNRFLSMEGLDKQRDEYFGSHQWTDAIELTGEEREIFLVDLYKRNLKETTGAEYVFAYRICYPNKRQTYYYLIHATNNIDGIDNMKNSFAQINNGRMEYLGRLQNELTIFDMDTYKSNELAKDIIKIFSGQNLTFKNILKQIIEKIPFIQKDLAEAISLLEKEGKVKVKRISSKRGRYRDLDEIQFGEIE